MFLPVHFRTKSQWSPGSDLNPVLLPRAFPSCPLWGKAAGTSLASQGAACAQAPGKKLCEAGKDAVAGFVLVQRCFPGSFLKGEKNPLYLAKVVVVLLV